MYINVKDLEIIKNNNVSMSIMKHYISDILNDSEYFSAQIDTVDSDSGKYQIVLKGKLKLDEIHNELYLYWYLSGWVKFNREQ